MKFNLNLLNIESQTFCEGIVTEMMSLFSIGKDEAVGRIERHWAHLDSIGGEEELIYHEDEKFWAKDIYFGADSYWWLSPEARSKQGMPLLVPTDFKNV